MHYGFVLYEEGWGIYPQTFPNGGRWVFKILPILNKEINFCLKWHENPPTSHVVPCKKLRVKCLLTFLGMVDSCKKENGEGALWICSSQSLC